MNSLSRLFLIACWVVFQYFLSLSIPWNGWVPDLLMLGVVFFSLLEGKRSAFWSGLALGLIKDACSGGRFFWALTWAVTAPLLASFRNQIYRDAPHTQMLATLLFGLMTQIFFYQLSALVQDVPAFGATLLFAILPTSLVTTLLAPVVLGGALRFSRLPA